MKKVKKCCYSFQKVKCTFIWKEDFGPLSNSPVVFLFSPGKMLLMMFLVQKWLGSSFPEDVWAWWLLTPVSVQSLWSSLKCLNRLCLTVLSSLRLSQLLLHIFLPNFFLPVNFAFNILWYSTPWTAPPPPSVMPLCDLLSLWRVSMTCLPGPLSVNSVPLYCAFKEQEMYNVYCKPQCILYGWSFIETQM